MYNGKCINPQLMNVICNTGHTDTICVADAGLPIPMTVERVDLAWKKNQPRWLEVCEMMKDTMAIEKIYLAEEMKIQNPEMLKEFLEIFEGYEVSFISHEQLKVDSNNCRAVVRTGEFSPYCNCIFVAGVVF